MIELRSSQGAAIEQARAAIAEGKRRPVIVAPCGYGKSVVAAEFVRAAIAKGRRVWFCVDRQILVNQMSRMLHSYGIDHGVMMADHPGWKQSQAQVVSLQTIEKRGWDALIDVLVVDEAHATMRKTLLEYLKLNPRVAVIGLTATPFTRGMGKIYNAVVNPTTTNKQIAEGYLVPLKIYSCAKADMAGARLIAGEYADDEVRERGRKIVGDIVSTWVAKTQEHFGGPVKSICFTADVAHGADIVKAFNEAGYRFEQISYLDANQERRDALIQELRKPESGLWGLVSCGVLTRGFDVTNILCGIDARPLRKSLSEVVQKVGRVQRAHPGKEFALWLDHAGNIARFGPEITDLFENGVQSLDEADAKPPRKEPDAKEAVERFCPKCGLQRVPRALRCACGYEFPRQRTIEVVPGHLVPVVLGGRKLADNQRHLYAQIVTHNRGWGKPETVAGRSWHHFKKMYGVAPPRDWKADAVENVEVSAAVAGKIQQMRIAYRKGRR